jgi:hypothetical protein
VADRRKGWGGGQVHEVTLRSHDASNSGKEKRSSSQGEPVVLLVQSAPAIFNSARLCCPYGKHTVKRILGAVCETCGGWKCHSAVAVGWASGQGTGIIVGVRESVGRSIHHPTQPSCVP